ncbi:hypothetical protein LES60_14180 [Pectobacterium brasiliense]|uniref:Uncharacterized protein n=3 Tax=Pectobacterium TaxID=122277 RepID=A0ABS0RYL3_PECPM|nr:MULTISPECIES: hypothetical protein [Pectobacterium]GKW25798.1 hypothetical protein PEC311524_33920 [Pectobacterium carotovorum subsp. carotovorum]ACX86438.1 hypothetical protein Pecwa_0614 [Pectobacterium parmentieri WPP163]MBA0211964.1 hypothetical protein [Pectobacterium brasiliense]MBI0471240.1 hypothetical protein [Pectobacterium parmentieri]MBI0493852.1 hypothetical protein [Pectobacterium parmentieri]
MTIKRKIWAAKTTLWLPSSRVQLDGDVESVVVELFCCLPEEKQQSLLAAIHRAHVRMGKLPQESK